MDISSISGTRYAERAFDPVFYQQQPQRAFPGGTLGPVASSSTPGASPLPGSNWPSEDCVWVSLAQEVAGQEMIHVTEAGQRLLGKMQGIWEVQSWLVRRFQDEQNSMERAAQASRSMTQSAVNTLISLGSKLQVAGSSIDIYA